MACCIHATASLGKPYPITRLHPSSKYFCCTSQKQGCTSAPLSACIFLAPTYREPRTMEGCIVTCRKNVPGNPITCQIPFLANHLSTRKTIQPINSFDLQDNIFVARRKSLDFFNAQVNFCLIPTPSTNQNCSFFSVSILLHIATMAVSPTILFVVHGHQPIGGSERGLWLCVLHFAFQIVSPSGEEKAARRPMKSAD